MPPSFDRPPNIQKMPPEKEASAFSAELAFVALESLMKKVRPARPTSSMRCGRPGKLRNAASMKPLSRNSAKSSDEASFDEASFDEVSFDKGLDAPSVKAPSRPCRRELRRQEFARREDRGERIVGIMLAAQGGNALEVVDRCQSPPRMKPSSERSAQPSLSPPKAFRRRDDRARARRKARERWRGSAHRRN